jgi:tryptophanyl-tRNA synthetase
MQDEAECLFFLADLHALTVDVDPAQLSANVREMAAALIASGIDPAKSTLFTQSAVPAHSELAWILQCTARMGWVERMTQFKERAASTRNAPASACSPTRSSRRRTSSFTMRRTCPSARTRSSILNWLATSR